MARPRRLDPKRLGKSASQFIEVLTDGMAAIRQGLTTRNPPMRRLLCLLLALFASLPPVTGAWAASAGARDPSIVIGVIATLTGPHAVDGQDIVDGVNLALKQLNNRFSNQEVRVAVADDKGQVGVAQRQVRRMLDHERMDVLVTGLSQPSLTAILPMLVDSRLFIFNLDQVTSDLAGAGCSPWLFNLTNPFGGPHEAVGQFLTNERVRRLVVIGPELDSTGDAVTALKRTYGGEVVKVLTPRQGAMTFKDELANIAQLHPDAVYSLLGGGMGGAFVRAWGEWPQKGETLLVPTWNAMERPYLAAMGDAALDLPSLATWSPDLDNPQSRRMVSDFENEYGRPATLWAVRGYDTVMLLDSALKATGGKTGNPDLLRSALRRADFQSAQGGLKFNTNHMPIQTYFLRHVVRDAKNRYTQELENPVLRDWRDPQANACPMRWVEEPLPGQAPPPKKR